MVGATKESDQCCPPFTCNKSGKCMPAVAMSEAGPSIGTAADVSTEGAFKAGDSPISKMATSGAVVDAMTAKEAERAAAESCEAGTTASTPKKGDACTTNSKTGFDDCCVLAGVGKELACVDGKCKVTTCATKGEACGSDAGAKTCCDDGNVYKWCVKQENAVVSPTLFSASSILRVSPLLSFICQPECSTATSRRRCASQIVVGASVVSTHS